jgi:hypothetical protein
MARNYYDNEGCFTDLFKIGIIITVFLGTFAGIISFLNQNSNYINNNYTTLFFFLIITIIIISVSTNLSQKTKFKTKLIEIEKENQKKINSIEKEIKEIRLQKSEFEEKFLGIKTSMAKKDLLYESYKNLNLFNISTLYSDFLTLEYSLSEDWLENKEIITKHSPIYYTREKAGRPAKKSAEIVSELKKETRNYIEQFKIMQYKYEALLNLFPELKNYVDDIESIQDLASYKNINAIKEEYDKVVDFVSKEDYQNLTVDERNQLALDNYIKGKKSKWQIGRDFELYCAFNYEKYGWRVERFGIEKQLNDMGRDLIAHKDNTIHIIQCKLWASDKLIHEKHIAQLYGSTIEYSISIETTLFKSNVIPVFITNIDLSETAKKFATRLNVEVYKWTIQEYPRIKCNINNGEKIYHLPFDQQYDKTQIKNDGEFYALTVNEAVEKGFKRAKKHIYNKRF